MGTAGGACVAPLVVVVVVVVAAVVAVGLPPVPVPHTAVMNRERPQ